MCLCVCGGGGVRVCAHVYADACGYACSFNGYVCSFIGCVLLVPAGMRVLPLIPA